MELTAFSSITRGRASSHRWTSPFNCGETRALLRTGAYYYIACPVWISAQFLGLTVSSLSTPRQYLALCKTCVYCVLAPSVYGGILNSLAASTLTPPDKEQAMPTSRIVLANSICSETHRFGRFAGTGRENKQSRGHHGGSTVPTAGTAIWQVLRMVKHMCSH